MASLRTRTTPTGGTRNVGALVRSEKALPRGPGCAEVSRGWRAPRPGRLLRTAPTALRRLSSPLSRARRLCCAAPAPLPHPSSCTQVGAHASWTSFSRALEPVLWVAVNTYPGAQANGSARLRPGAALMLAQEQWRSSRAASLRARRWRSLHGSVPGRGRPPPGNALVRARGSRLHALLQEALVLRAMRVCGCASVTARAEPRLRPAVGERIPGSRSRGTRASLPGSRRRRHCRTRPPSVRAARSRSRPGRPNPRLRTPRATAAKSARRAPGGRGPCERARLLLVWPSEPRCRLHLDLILLARPLLLSELLRFTGIGPELGVLTAAGTGAWPIPSGRTHALGGMR